jgi:protein O-GlcNAc transferase
MRVLPETLAAVLNEAIASHRSGQMARAQAGYHRVLADAPGQFDALHLLGVLHQQSGDAPGALVWFEQALAVDATSADAHANCAATLRDLHRPDDALAACDRALVLRPGHVDALTNRAAALLDTGRLEEALAAADAALAVQPQHAAAHYNRANALRRLGRVVEALDAFDRALAQLPGHGPLWVHRGNLLLELGHVAAAAASLERALALLPDDAATRLNHAHALAASGRLEPALDGYRRAHALAPKLPGALGALLHTRLQLCDWDGLDADFETLARGIEAGEPLAAPFAVATAPLSAAQRRRCAEAFVRELFPASGTPPGFSATADAPGAADGRIRLGYFSSDFREHATAYLGAGLFEQHDRRRFELFAFSFGPPADDPMRRRIAAAFEHFHDVATLPDDTVVALARQLRIDIAVDLNGHTRWSRTGLFARRVAPLQLSYLGYPGTLGAPYCDYLVADATVIPPGDEVHFTEKVIRLPHCYQINDDRRPIAALRPTRSELGLPDDGFVWCCFNRAEKITPDVFEVWMRLLRQVDRSVLWLLRGHPTAWRRLQAQAERHGVAAARLVPAGPLPLPEHLARHGAADLFLDTFHYNAHTTGSDALWAGLPVLSRRGEHFASRVGASLLQAVGLPELVTPDTAAYESLALALATDPERLAGLKHRLQTLRRRQPLFDTTLTTRHLEDAFQSIWQRHRDGLPPEHLWLPARSASPDWRTPP